MNKYVSMFLQVLKYIGIFLLVVYLYFVVKFYNNPMTSNGIKDKSFIAK